MGRQSRLRSLRRQLRSAIKHGSITAAWANEQYRRVKGRTPKGQIGDLSRLDTLKSPNLDFSGIDRSVDLVRLAEVKP